MNSQRWRDREPRSREAGGREAGGRAAGGRAAGGCAAGGRAIRDGEPGSDTQDIAGAAATTAVTDLAFAVPLALAPLLGGALAGLFWWAFGTDLVLVALVPLGLWLGVMAVIDARELRIPNRLVLIGAVGTVPLLIVASASDWPDLSLLRAVAAAVVHFAIYFLLVVIWPDGIGGGDAKLAGLLGAHVGLFGWLPVFRGIVFAHVLAGLVAIAILAIGLASLGRVRWKTAFPLGPFMAAGAVLALVLEARG